MNIRTHFKTDTTSFANGFLLLVMVAGVLNIDLFESAGVPAYLDHKVLYRIELVFNAERFGIRSRLLSISEDIPENDVVVKDRTLPSHFYATCFGNALFVIQNTGKVNTRPFYSLHNHTRLFNVPHQNSDEDEAFILSVNVV